MRYRNAGCHVARVEKAKVAAQRRKSVPSSKITANGEEGEATGFMNISRVQCHLGSSPSVRNPRAPLATAKPLKDDSASAKEGRERGRGTHPGRKLKSSIKNCTAARDGVTWKRTPGINRPLAIATRGNRRTEADQYPR